MTKKDDPDRRELFSLMERYNQLGRMLPAADDIMEDQDAKDRARLVLAEMNKKAGRCK